METSILTVSIGPPDTPRRNMRFGPFHFSSDGYDSSIDNISTPIEKRIAYRAERRNNAVRTGLKHYPDTTDIFMVDSHFLLGETQLEQLVQRYRQLPRESGILGPVVWGYTSTTLSSWLVPKAQFYDAWSTPELRWCPRGWKPQNDILTRQEKVPLKGLYQVSSIGGIYIFPRKLWTLGVRYGVPQSLHGCEHNFFHNHSYYPKYIDFTVEFERDKRYSFSKCLRCSLGNWKRNH